MLHLFSLERLIVCPVLVLLVRVLIDNHVGSHRYTRRLRTAAMHSLKDLKINPTFLVTGELVGDL